MDNLSTVMLIIAAVGMFTVIICVCSLIQDSRKHHAACREIRRKNLSENTAKTILAYNARQQNEAMYYRRRA